MVSCVQFSWRWRKFSATWGQSLGDWPLRRTLAKRSSPRGVPCQGLVARKSSCETSLLTLVSKGRIFPSSREQKRPRWGGYSPHLSYSKAPLMLPRGPLRMHRHQQVPSETPEAGRPWLEYQPPKASYLTLRALPSLKKRSNSFESLNEIT